MMGAHVLEQSRQSGVGKLVIAGRCARTRSSPRCRSARTTSGTATPRRRTRRTASRRSRCSSARRRTAQQYGLNAIFLLPTNLYGPRDNFHPTNAHVIPDLIRKMVDSPRGGRALGRRLADARVPLRRRLRRGPRPRRERYDGADPVNLGAGKEISIRDLAELVADVTGSTGGSTGTRRSRTASRGAASTPTRARELFGFEARTPLRDGLERTVAWYREHARVARLARAVLIVDAPRAARARWARIEF